MRASAISARCVLILALVGGLAVPALAVDGVREINQTCAVTTGCFSGDAAGFPVTISVPASYRLTSNLSGVIAQITIFVTSSDVTLDLKGFTLSGPSSGNADGIQSTQENVTVSNGTVQNMGGSGLRLGDRARVESVRSLANGSHGISVGAASIVRACTVLQNSLAGISAGSAAGGEFSGNIVRANVNIGIGSGTDSTVAGNTVTANTDIGIFCSSRCMFQGNTVNGNTLQGIKSNLSGLAIGNHIMDNGGVGLSLSTGGYAQNLLRGNNGGDANPQVGAGAIEIGTNLCGTNTTCP